MSTSGAKITYNTAKHVGDIIAKRLGWKQDAPQLDKARLSLSQKGQMTTLYQLTQFQWSSLCCDWRTPNAQNIMQVSY